MTAQVYTVPDFLGAARKQKESLQSDLVRLEQQLALHEQRVQELQKRTSSAEGEIMAALLPNLETSTVQAVANRCGFPALVSKDFPGQMEKERLQRQRRIVRIQAEPQYRDRKLLRDPGVGKLTRAIAELMEFRQPSADLIKKCEHPRLGTLLSTGYGTPAYNVPFWRASYYANWKAGDEILERFGEKKEFLEIRLEYLDALKSLQTYDMKLAELRAEVKAGEDLEKELANQEDALTSLESRYAGLARAALGEYLRDLPQDALAEVLTDGPALGMMAKRWAGLSKQVQYLDSIKSQELEPLRARIQEDIRRLDSDITKYNRPKKAFTTFPKDKFNQRFVERPQKLRKQVDRTVVVHNTVYGFDQYQRANLVQNFLWWDLMTDGRIDGNFIPEVRSFHESNPGYSYHRDRAYDDDFASASAAVSQGGGTGRPLLGDAS